jgi:uncharacterized protein (DUF952 family)
MSQSTPQYLYKITTPELWHASQTQESLSLSAEDEAFIHLATEAQVGRVLQKFWEGRSSILLTLDAAQLRGRLVYEQNREGGGFYYHLYAGSIPLESVIEVQTDMA